MHKCRRYGLDKLSLWPFYHLTFKCDLDLQPEQMFRMTLLLLKENNCAKLFLKSMHIYRSYGLDKLNLWPLQVWPLLSTYVKRMFQMARFLLKDNNCAKSFWNLCINVEVKLWPGTTHTDARRHITEQKLLLYCKQWPLLNREAKQERCLP